MSKKWTNDDWTKYLGGIDDPLIEPIDDYVNMTTPIRIRFVDCNHIVLITPHNFKNRKYCHLCKKNDRIKNATIGVSNNLIDTHPHICEFLLNKDDGYKYSFGSEKKIDWKCTNCGNIIKNKSICSVVSRGILSCSICSDGFSLPNKMMYSLLNELNVDFVSEYRPSWLRFEFNGFNRSGYYDFYFKLNNEEYVVEMDGDWHKKNNQYSGQTKEESSYIDLNKDNLAAKNNIKMIRIDCFGCTFEIIKNAILNSEIKKIFGLDDISWETIYEQTVRPIVFNICEEFNKDSATTSTKLAEDFGITKQSIIKYLKQGKRIGLCDYDPEEEMRRRYENIRIPVVCTTLDKVYDSITSASLGLVSTNNVSLNAAKKGISRACNGMIEYFGEDILTGNKLYWEFFN